jgi:hypothetical protein
VRPKKRCEGRASKLVLTMSASAGVPGSHWQVNLDGNGVALGGKGLPILLSESAGVYFLLALVNPAVEQSDN